jgi:predicted Zn-dependent protease
MKQQSPFFNLPQWIKIIIRIILLPIAFVLHLVPHIIGITVNMKNWVLYGGEFMVYNQDDQMTMTKIYKELKSKTNQP